MRIFRRRLCDDNLMSCLCNLIVVDCSSSELVESVGRATINLMEVLVDGINLRTRVIRLPLLP